MLKYSWVLVTISSVNWWIFLWTWTWGEKHPTGDMIAANATTSFIILVAGFIAWGYHMMRHDDHEFRLWVANRKRKGKP